MATKVRSSDPKDPLASHSGLTLFPRTLAWMPDAPKPYDSGDLQRVHSYLKSMLLHSPEKLLEQAKAIVDNTIELPDNVMPSYVTSKDKNEAVDAMNIEIPRERRPALGRKRARFSLKAKSSQPTADLEPTMDIDKLKDPEEFFLAFEKFENAKRELQKQTGTALMELNHQNPSMAARPRRPGMLRRSVKYKHRYSDATSFQGMIEENIVSPSSCKVDQETTKVDFTSQETDAADAELPKMESSGSIAKIENTINGLLHDLLAGDSEDLDGDGAVSLLQEHLQIKPIDVGKLSLPDLQDIRIINLKASGAKLPKPRNPLSDIHNVLKGTGSATKTKRQTESPVSSLASPTPPRNPLESIVSLKKRISQSNLVSDPFSAHDIQNSPSRNAPPSEGMETQADQVFMEKDLTVSHEMGSMGIGENDNAGANVNLLEVNRGGVGGSSGKTVQNFSSQNIDKFMSRSASASEGITIQTDQLMKEKDLSFSTERGSFMIEGNDNTGVNMTEGMETQTDQAFMEEDLSISYETGSMGIEENDNADANVNLLEVNRGGVGGSSGKTMQNPSSQNVDKFMSRSASASEGITIQTDQLMKEKDLSFSTERDSFMIEGNDNTGVNMTEGMETQTDQVFMEEGLSISYETESMGIEENDNAGANLNLLEVNRGGVGGSSGKTGQNPSSQNINKFMSRSASASEGITIQTDQLMKEKDLSFSTERGSFMIEGNDNTGVNMRGMKIAIQDIGGSSSKTVSDNRITHGSGVDGCSNRCHANAKDSADTSCMDSRVVNEMLDRPDCDATVQINEAMESNEKVEDTPKELADALQPDLNLKDSTVEKPNNSWSELADQASPFVTNGSSEAAANSSEQHDEQEVQASTQVPLNERSKRISRQRKGSKGGVSRRQSLAASGTSWESGVRRSTRIRSRPLEYWRGERFLYGRVHQTLTTVIGIKYESPTKEDGQPAIKVKSFVADQYKNLVDQAARF